MIDRPSGVNRSHVEYIALSALLSPIVGELELNSGGNNGISRSGSDNSEPQAPWQLFWLTTRPCRFFVLSGDCY